jgi:hypothetical protein
VSQEMRKWFMPSPNQMGVTDFAAGEFGSKPDHWQDDQPHVLL